MKWQENKKLHDDHWGMILKNIESLIEEDIDLDDLWMKNNLFELKNSSLGRVFDNAPYIYERYARYASIEKILVLKNKIINDVVSKYIDHNTDLIIDLGSGWGRNSIQLTKTYNNKILACELSDAGRAATDIISEKYNLNIKTLPFNYYKYGNLIDTLRNKEYEKIVFFSYHSIEQIPEIEKGLFQSIVDLKIENISCFHVEPVGWQVLRTPKTTEKRYNNNLISVLRKLEAENQIAINNIEVDHFGFKHSNTGTLIEWSKK